MNEIIEELQKEFELKKMQMQLAEANYNHQIGLLTLDMKRINREIMELESGTDEGTPYYMN